MSKGRYAKKKSGTLPVWILAVVLVVLAAVIFFLMNAPGQTPDTPSSTAGNQGASTQSNTGDAPETEVAPSSGAQSADPVQTTGGAAGGNEDPAVPTTQAPGQNQNPSQPAQTQPQASEGQADPTRATVMQQADADYEQWLAAAMVVCVSMEYPDFELEGIYATSVTDLNSKYDSDGVYIIFVSGGERMAIFSKALDAERKEAGTMDISTEVIGYASFDLVDPSTVNTAAMTAIQLDDLTTLIEQSLLVSIYIR